MAYGDYHGAFHPTRQAHTVMSSRVEPLLCRELYGNDECEGPFRG